MFLILKSNYYKGILLVFIGAFCFSTKGIFAKLAFRYGVTGLEILTLRMLFSLPFYIAIYIIQQKKHPVKISKNTFLQILFLGIIGYYLAALFDFLGLQFVSANLERVIIFTYPTFVLLLGFIFYKRNISRIQISAILLSYVGILIAFISDYKTASGSSIFLGVLYVLLSALTYAFYLVRSDKLILQIGTAMFTCISMIISCIAVLIHFGIVNQFSIFNYPLPVYLIGVCIAIISTVLPSFLMTAGIKYIGSSNMSIVASIGPVSTIFLSFYVLNEDVTFLHITGTVFVLAGILALTFFGGKSTKSNF